MSSPDVAEQRLLNHHLVGPPLGSPVEAVGWFGAVQSQDYGGAKWGIGQRMSAGVQESELDRAFDDGEILRTHVLRPTWHFVTPQDIGWLLELTAPRVQAANAGRYRQLGLDPATLTKAEGVITQAVAGGNHLTRSELAVVLNRSRISTEGQRLPYLLMHTELQALICSGPRRGKQHTYALLSERAPEGRHMNRERAATLLARRYFASHGPATAHDFAWWSGMTLRDARSAISQAGEEITAQGQRGDDPYLSLAGCVPPTSDNRATAHLLPSWDEYLVAYADHSVTFDTERLGGVTPSSPGLSRNIVIVNGHVVGSWRRTLHTHDVDVELQILLNLTHNETSALEKAVRGYAAFIDRSEVRISTERT